MRGAFLQRLVLLLLLWSGVGHAAGRHGLTVHFFDVGQGDSALIVAPNGKTVLIDGGPPEAGPELARRLKRLVKGPLDSVVLTHAHLDHLGGLLDVLPAVGARRYMDPGFAHPSESYTRLLKLVDEKVPETVKPEVDRAHEHQPLRIGLGEGVALTVLWPRSPVEPYLEHTRSDVNANSIILRLTYGTTAFFFAADAEEETETRLLRLPPAPLRADVLKVAHHGSRYSSSAEFLDAVRPKIAIVSSGAGNDYGHPSQQTLDRLRERHVRTLRTDQVGDVRVTSDGRRVQVQVDARRQTEPPFAASRRSPVFHRRNCATMRSVPRGDLVTYASREDALLHRHPAEDCHP